MVEHTEFWGSPVGQRNERPRPLESAQCSLCGIELPKGLMMPDGGRACADIRWYCKDARSCTERWTAQLSRGVRPAPEPGERAGLALERSPMALERPAAALERPATLERPAAALEAGEAQESQRAGGL